MNFYLSNYRNKNRFSIVFMSLNVPSNNILETA